MKTSGDSTACSSSTSWLRPLFIGLAPRFTGSYRIGILVPVIFFVAGLVLLARVDVRRAAIEAGSEAPSNAAFQ